MRVAASSLQMQAQYQHTVSYQESISLSLRVPVPTEEQAGRPAADRLSLSSEGLSAASAAGQVEETAEERGLTPEDKLISQIVRRMFKAITGRDFVMFSPEQLQQRLERAEELPPNATAQAPASESAEPATVAGTGIVLPPGFGLSYERRQSYTESESFSFAAEGTLLTKDGQELSFSVTLNMSRSFTMERSESLRLGTAIDPLVVNYEGNAADLTQTRFEFDLDADGTPEQLSELGRGSAFLALDKNEDGRINDGRELFGPTTGKGFGELAVYDEDGNDFIDAGDPIFDKLRLWVRDGEGGSRLLALGQAGIGALYLGHLSTPFQLTDERNQSLGQISSTGLFFREDGSAGTVQQLDYKV